MEQSSKILIVDDNPVNVDLLEAILDEDYTLATAASGEEALTVVQDFQPDIVLLDIMMPGIDGYETCRRMRDMPGLQHLKIMMVSAKAMVSERLEGYEAGADDYITKPFDDAELVAKVRVYLRLKSLEEANRLKSDVLTWLGQQTITALNGLNGTLEFLMDEPAIDQAQRTELLRIAHQNSKALYPLYIKALTLGALRNENPNSDQALAELSSQVKQAVAQLAPHAASRDVELGLASAETTLT